MSKIMEINWSDLRANFAGEIDLSPLAKLNYSTDASAYQEEPLGVVFPRNKADVVHLIRWADEYQVALIPRTAGTSLAGQVVGSGLVVDVSRHLNQIYDVNLEESSIWVDPGVVRDELNLHLDQWGLFYGPETSTSNRCMIGGMVGNNSCGSRSLVFGSAREHLLEAEVVLANGEEVRFKHYSQEEWEALLTKPKQEYTRAEEILFYLHSILQNKENRDHIADVFPMHSIPRRNTGYALDVLALSDAFEPKGPPFNLCQILAGSEGTLAFITRLKLNLCPVLPPEKCLVAIHSHSIDESLRANLVALKYKPTACELMDAHILECTKASAEQKENRFFLQGDPAAVLIVEFCEASVADLEGKLAQMIQELKDKQLGYHFPKIVGDDIPKVWNLRKAGLGVLSNTPGDAKPAPVIEDTAVRVEDLPAYIADFNAILQKHDLHCVHYAHAATGELHLRPILNLKTEEGNRLFREIATEIALLVKKYGGSLSGEHGDGRLRGEFIPLMVGERVMEWFEGLKDVADPKRIFNPGKIVHTPPMDEQLRFFPGQETPEFDTALDFSHEQGFIRAVENCNGSGDCRKTHIIGGTMCPSFMATREEKDTTRGRANVLRNVLNGKGACFSDERIQEALDLCISCKGCKKECPSNVDMAKIKAEVLHQQHLEGKTSWRSKAMANSMQIQAKFEAIPGLYNWFLKGWRGRVFKNGIGIHPTRNLPLLAPKSFFRSQKAISNSSEKQAGKRVVLWVDEFTNLLEPELAISAQRVLLKLGYQVLTPRIPDSGRTFISKGFLDKAKVQVSQVMGVLAPFLEEGIDVVGIEPSTLLGFQDEYPLLCNSPYPWEQWKSQVKLVDQFLVEEYEAGNWNSEVLKGGGKHRIRLHGHCHQKALSSVVWTKKLLGYIPETEVLLIPSGCCGMAGSFGYEKEHFETSQKIGELVLFPTVKGEAETTIIAAPGTSCRHQIADGTGRIARHPIQIFEQALC